MDRRNPTDPPSKLSSTTSILGQIKTNEFDLPPWQATLISQIVACLKSNYVIPEKIDESTLCADLISKFKERLSEYQSEEDVTNQEQFAKAFAKSVTMILQELIGDGHIALNFEPSTIKDEENKVHLERYGKLAGDRPLGEPEVMTTQREEIVRKDLIADHCGFHDPSDTDQDLIPKNVGYIRLLRMWNTDMFSMVKEEAFRAMQRVQDKDAVIIDLRDNGGGSPAAVQYILSFFFAEPTHINTIKKREEGSWQEKVFKTFPRNQLNPGGEFQEQAVPDLSKKPVYILINENTRSAGEEMAYDMQQLKHATIIGKPSWGGAHPTGPKPLLDPRPHGGKNFTFNESFILYVPSATSENPITHDNWEDNRSGKKGVQPHIEVDSTDALARAVKEIQAPKLTNSREFKL